MKKGISRNTFELSVETKSLSPVSEELVKEVLASTGVDVNDIVSSQKGSKLRMCVYFYVKKEGERVVSALKAFGLRNISMKFKEIRTAQWRDLWKKDFRTFALTASIDIVPLWGKQKYRSSKKIPIYMDTQLAFGTGLHETTRFMARLIENSKGQFRSFLDVGTGTGILAMVAYYSGADRVLAVDHDPHSISMARRNLFENKIRGVQLKRLDIGQASNISGMDMVCANLTTEDLIRFQRKLVRLVKKGGLLALSGISLANFPRLKKAFSLPSLKCLNVIRGKEWAAVLFQRIM